MAGIFYSDVPSANKQAESWTQKQGGRAEEEEEERAGVRPTGRGVVEWWDEEEQSEGKVELSHKSLFVS